MTWCRVEGPVPVVAFYMPCPCCCDWGEFGMKKLGITGAVAFCVLLFSAHARGGISPFITLFQDIDRDGYVLREGCPVGRQVILIYAEDAFVRYLDDDTGEFRVFPLNQTGVMSIDPCTIDGFTDSGIRRSIIVLDRWLGWEFLQTTESPQELCEKIAWCTDATGSR